MLSLIVLLQRYWLRMQCAFGLISFNVSMVFGDPQALSSVLAELGYRAFGSLRSRTLDDCI